MKRIVFLLSIFLMLAGCLENDNTIITNQVVAKGAPVTLDGSAAADNNRDISSYDWTFGDGQGASGKQVVHTYNNVEEYKVALTVTDKNGSTKKYTCTITVYDADKDTSTDTLDLSAMLTPARHAEPVVMTGSQLPAWSRLAAVGYSPSWPAGAGLDAYCDDLIKILASAGDSLSWLTGTDAEKICVALFKWTNIRSAHNGILKVPFDVRKGVPVNQICAFRWDGAKWIEIPVQVDERFPYFLSNTNSIMGTFSSVDQELTYAWDVERWEARPEDELFAQYSGAMPDPVPTLDDDDEISFMASDTGLLAPRNSWPADVMGSSRQQIILKDSLNPAKLQYVYLFLRETGSTFNDREKYPNGYYAIYKREADADQFISRDTFKWDDPEILGSSNTIFGPNLPGYAYDPLQKSDVSNAYPRKYYQNQPYGYAGDRFPRDSVTVMTDNYKWYASGRWMVREMHIRKPGRMGVYGPDLIDRWKGRAFQQTPDSTVSKMGFEDEQINWEANSCLIGERVGPVRAIRETWGADSGTNLTKTEIFYRNAVAYRYRIRVHPIPTDGLYTSWDYNAGTVAKYYNAYHLRGVDIDGKPDELLNELTEIEKLKGETFFIDIPDPTFDLPLAFLRWEQVSGRNDYGSLVYVMEMKGRRSLFNGIISTYYRDDMCFDDGTGDDPVPRPLPGMRQSIDKLNDYRNLPCDQKQGAWGSHGLHLLFFFGSDNLFTSIPINEIDVQQWQFAVPTHKPMPVGRPYAQILRFPLETRTVLQNRF